MTKPELKRLLKYLKSLPSDKERDFFIKKLEKESKPIKPRSAKNKGANFQKEVCKGIAKTINIPWGTDDDALIAPRPMGQHGTDVILRGEAKEKFPFAVEAKNQEKLSLWATINQARNNKGTYDYWIVCHKKNHEKPVIVLDMEDFFKIYEKTLDM